MDLEPSASPSELRRQTHVTKVDCHSVRVRRHAPLPGASPPTKRAASWCGTRAAVAVVARNTSQTKRAPIDHYNVHENVFAQIINNV